MKRGRGNRKTDESRDTAGSLWGVAAEWEEKMRGLFCPMCKARNNEEYRAVLKKCRIKMCLCILAGMATVGISLFVHFCTRIELSDYRLGFLLGMGSGLALGGAVGLWKIRRRLADEEKLKECRLKETDERELEVASLALRGAARLVLGALYVLLVLGGLFKNDELMWVCWGLIGIFLLSNIVLRKYYETKI